MTIVKSDITIIIMNIWDQVKASLVLSGTTPEVFCTLITMMMFINHDDDDNDHDFVVREGVKKLEKAVSLTAAIFENVDPFLSFIEWQNNPKYDNLSRIFYIFLTASGEGGEGSTQAVSLTAFFPFFFYDSP